MTEIESDKGRPLTPEENAELRSLLDREHRVEWFWSSIRVWAMWVAAVIGGLYAAKTFLHDVLISLAGKGS